MKQQKIKKLNLKQETISSLNRVELSSVKGQAESAAICTNPAYCNAEEPVAEFQAVR